MMLSNHGHDLAMALLPAPKPCLCSNPDPSIQGHLRGAIWHSYGPNEPGEKRKGGFKAPHVLILEWVCWSNWAYLWLGHLGLPPFCFLAGCPCHQQAEM